MDRSVRIDGPLIPFISAYNFPIKLKFKNIDKRWFKNQIGHEIVITQFGTSINKDFYSQIYKLPEIKQWKIEKYKTAKNFLMLINHKIINCIEGIIKRNDHKSLDAILNNQSRHLYDDVLNPETPHILNIFPYNLVLSNDLFYAFMNHIWVTTIMHKSKSLKHSRFHKFDYIEPEIVAEVTRYEQLIPLLWYINFDSDLCKLLSKEYIGKLLFSTYSDTNFKFAFAFTIEHHYSTNNIHILFENHIDKFFRENNALLLNQNPYLFFNFSILYNHPVKHLIIFYYDDNTIIYQKDYSDISELAPKDVNSYPPYLIVVVYSNEYLPRKILEVVKDFKKEVKFNVETMNIISNESFR
jgi:hypothetical protein